MGGWQGVRIRTLNHRDLNPKVQTPTVQRTIESDIVVFEGGFSKKRAFGTPGICRDNGVLTIAHVGMISRSYRSAQSKSHRIAVEQNAFKRGQDAHRGLRAR